MWPFRKPKQCPEDTGKHQLQEPEPSPNFGDLERPLNIVQFPPYLHHKFTTSDRTYLNLWRWVLLNFKIFHSVMDHPTEYIHKTDSQSQGNAVARSASAAHSKEIVNDLKWEWLKTRRNSLVTGKAYLDCYQPNIQVKTTSPVMEHQPTYKCDNCPTNRDFACSYFISEYIRAKVTPWLAARQQHTVVTGDQT